MPKKLLLLLLASILVVSAGTVKKTIKFQEVPTVTEKGEVSMGGCYPIGQLYAPDVCVRTVKLALPVGEQVKSVSVEYGELVNLEGKFKVNPHMPIYNKKGSAPRNLPLTSEIKSKINSFYSQDASYPSAKRSIKYFNGTKNGITIGMATVYPVQYNPVQEKLSYYKEATVTMETEPINKVNKQLAALNFTPLTKSLIQRLVDNPLDLNKIPYTQKDGDDYEYLVVHGNVVQESAFNEFKTFNKERGLRTKVVKIQDVYSAITNARDNAEKLRKYILKEYTEHKIVFVLLAGDAGTNFSTIPVRQLNSIFYDHAHDPANWHEYKSAGDMYYSCLDGDWYNTSRKKYGCPGSEDMYWEVYVARMPIDNATDLGNLLNKTFKYSKTPIKDKVKRVLLLGGQLWVDEDGSDRFIWGKGNCDMYCGYKTAFNCTTNGIPLDGSWHIDSCCDRMYNRKNAWKNRGLKQHIDSDRPAWIEHDGHGNETYACQTNMSNINDNWITTNGTNGNFFFLQSGACNPGNFDDINDCWGARLVFIKNGAFACHLNNESGWGDNDDYNSPSGRPIRQFHDAHFNPKLRIPFLGAADAYSKEINADIVKANDTTASDPTGYFGMIRYSCYNTNIFGDPAVQLWTQNVQELDEAKLEIQANKAQLTIKTPPFTSVALVNSSGEIFTTQITGYAYDANNINSFVLNDSTCKIDDELYKTYAQTNQTVTVIIKAPNYIPKEFKNVQISQVSINNNNAGIISASYKLNTLGDKVRINFTLPTNDLVNVSLYNSKGALVKTLINKNLTAGFQSIDFKKNDLSNGVFYCKLRVNNNQSVRSFINTK